jgi:hypothetical protein
VTAPAEASTGANAAYVGRVGAHTITVVPETFAMVDYDAAAIAACAGQLCQRVGLPADVDLRVEVDQTTPLGRARIASTKPAVLAVESGALEDNYQPRQFHEGNASLVFGRLLLKLRDRLDPAFGDVPGDDDLGLELSAAWDAYATGRLGRLGYPTQRQRRLYQFRVRHGFSDDGDAAFNQLWEADNLTWADIAQLSSEAMVRAPAS